MATESRESILRLIDTWHFRTQKIQRSHYDAATHCERLNLLLGIPVMVVSALSGTSQLANLITSKIDWIVGSISLLVAALAALQMFMGYAQKTARHKLAATQYGAIRRAIEQAKAHVDDPTFNLSLELTSIRKQLDALAMESPQAPMRILKRHGHDPAIRPQTDEEHGNDRRN